MRCAIILRLLTQAVILLPHGNLYMKLRELRELKNKTFFNSLCLPILSGIFIGTSYIPFFPWAAIFSFVPLWIQWQRSKSLREVFIAGWVTAFVLTFIGFFWVGHLLHEFGGLPTPVAYLGLLFFCGFANLYIPLAGVVWFKLRSVTGPGFHSLLTLPMILWLMETFVPTIFPWNFGYTFFWIEWPALHLAEYIGAQGLSAIVIFANLISLMIWTHRRRKKTLIRWGLTLFALMVGINLVGWGILKQLKPPDKKLNVLIVQANIGNMEKIYAKKGMGFRDHITDKYIRLTRSAVRKFHNSKEDQEPPLSSLKKQKGHATGANLTEEQQNNTQNRKIDFVLWPETAFPHYLGVSLDNHSQARKVFQMNRQTQIPLITGAYSQSPDGKQTTNSVFFIDEKGKYTDKPYHKTYLLAFGEYIPLSRYFPIFKEWLPQVADLYPGDGPIVRPLKDLKIGTQICYESLFPKFSLELASRGAQIIINVTNDSWYGTWQEPYQHLYPTIARAAEVRRPLVRSTNTGISTAILASGKALNPSPLNREWSHVFEVPYVSDPKTTVYQAFPGLLPIVVLTLLVLELRAAYKENSDS